MSPAPPMMTLAEAHALLVPALPGALVHGDASTVVTRVHTDTRTLQAGDLFVALKGERFDAHDFLREARAAGATAAMVEDARTASLDQAGLPGLVVANTLHALQVLARAWRDRRQLPLIAVTGSNGKTTVTQMIATILRTWLGDAALATAGNLNNHIGVPLTVLRLRQDGHAWHRAAVVELGMNHPGEIAELAGIALPTVALVNNAQREHQEFMATVEAVARENGSAIEALPPNGTAVFPADDDFAPLWRRLAGHRPVLTFALKGAADVTGRATWGRSHWALELHTPAGDAPVELRAAGEHNLKNALAAAACALAAGAPLAAVRDGLQAFEPVKGRSRLVALDGATLVDDSYNANPDSVRAAIDLLASLPGPRWLVLGDMGEVGDRGPEFHAEVGAYAKQRGIESFWCAGAACSEAAKAYGADARHFAEVPALMAEVASSKPAFASVLVKGSRFMKMERVVQALAGRA